VSVAEIVAWVLVAAAVVGLFSGLWYLLRSQFQLCPHCAWIVRRVHHGWLRCPRCHKQYARRPRLRPH
jgi:hypothetical protein